jgi:demethylmenaquinone methyltransferase/2-methoxy-6-polyprenyl-1,4-benzoquinol methylase
MSALPAEDEKAVYVERMFSRIAAGYDHMNGVMTFGMDRGWRNAAVGAIAPPVGGRTLDVGTGTGDFLPILSAWTRNGQTVGVDFALPMMQAGSAKLGEHTAFVAGDALVLPFADESFDAITTGFVVRNVVDIQAAFAEMFRVARPGGMLACLEVARPRNPLLRFGHALYFQRLVPVLARLLGADPTAYTYLPQSAQRFPPPEALARIMHHAGWRDVVYRFYGMGAVAIHVGRKPKQRSVSQKRQQVFDRSDTQRRTRMFGID